MSEEKIESAKLLMKLINSLTSPIFIKNRKHQFVLVNDALCQMLGHSHDELMGKSDYDFSPKEEADIFWEMDNKVFESRIANINEEKHTDAFGNVRIIQTKKTIFEDSELGDCLCGVITDITELKQLNENLSKIAFRDTLSGLMNRAAFDEAFARYLDNFNSQCQKFALLYVDMDGLKFVNDSYGHPIGDELIKETGKRIFNALSSKGEVARIGGDEFMLLIPFHSRQEIVFIIEKILTSLKEPFKLEERRVILSASFGVACCPDDGHDMISLVQHADNSMYEAKRKSKGSYAFYKKEYTVTAKRKLELEGGLRVAIENQQLDVYFQPIFKNNTIVGYESLSRWFNSEYGTISPDEFIPIAEETGLIILLGEQVLQAAVEFIQRYCSSGEYVSVNVSPIQLKHYSFKEKLESIICPLSSQQLAIEVTEGVMMGVNVHLESLINSPRLKDIKYFIDDFGTGYSNWAQLKKLNFNTLKIDREFIKGLPSSHSDISLIKSMVFMANEFSMGIIAEGIETEEQKQCLIEIGCDYFQGNLLGKPAKQDCWRMI